MHVLSNYYDLDKMQVKLFPKFKSTPFDFLLIVSLHNRMARRRGCQNACV